MLETETEHVLVVPTQLFHDLGYFQGFCPESDRYLSRLLDPEQISFQPRDAMEQDPSFKQLIPYVVLCHKSPSGETLVFQYRRGTGQGEGRLHKKRSIGIGGHISTLDVQTQSSHDTYQEGLRRELEEEIEIGSKYQGRIAGLINDDQTPVGQVHLGVVHLFELDKPLAQPRETEIIEAGFRPAGELLAAIDEFETWSQICLKALFGT